MKPYITGGMLQAAQKKEKILVLPKQHRFMFFFNVKYQTKTFYITPLQPKSTLFFLRSEFSVMAATTIVKSKYNGVHLAVISKNHDEFGRTLLILPKLVE